MIDYFAKHPTAANLMMVAWLVLGLFVLGLLKRETMPEFSSETLQITAAYPGATAEEIEEAIALPIEEALAQVSGIKNISTSAMEGSVSVRVTMADGADWQQFTNDIKTKVEAINTFPSEFENLNIQQFNHTDQVVSVVVYGDCEMFSLKDYCEELKRKFEHASPEALVSISGFSNIEVLIELHPDIIVAHGLSVAKVASIIRSQNQDLPSGTLETFSKNIKLRFDDRRKTQEDIGELIVMSSAQGSELRLKDIATITRQFSSQDSKSIFNGSNSAVISIAKSKTADALTIYDQIMAVLKREEEEAPEGLHFSISRDMASAIKSRIEMVAINALEGLMLVFAALWIFLNLKLSFWVTMGLPTSFLGALFVMHAMGISLNMISTFALLIATGLLMDDAIVISENIASHLQKGKTPFQAAVDGTREVASGVISSFATTVCVFAPLMFLNGSIGKILIQVPTVLIIVLTISLIEAFFILPNHLAHTFKNGYPAPNAIRNKIDHAINSFRNGIIARITAWAVKKRYYVLAITLGFFIFSMALFPAGYLKFVAFPQTDGDTAVCRVQLPPGTPLQESERVANILMTSAKTVNEKLNKYQPDGKDIVKSISVNFSNNSDVSDSGPHLFTVYLDLLPGDERKSTLADVIAVWREATPEIHGALAIKFDDMSAGPGGKAIEIRLQGDDLEAIKSAAAELREKLASYAGVTDIADSLVPGKPEVVMSLKEGAHKLGLSATDVASQLRAAYQGDKADEIQIGHDSVKFNVKLTSDYFKNQDFFDNFKLVTASGKTLPLTTVVDVHARRGLSSINRYNRERTITVSA
ncbi:MAG: efflux RND transporter permease subunit, partial [Victivallales bacterium]|nr:efflux RND transporter permease subunit [Victivallales bacterium]